MMKIIDIYLHEVVVQMYQMYAFKIRARTPVTSESVYKINALSSLIFVS
jgi:hypothetical protein